MESVPNHFPDSPLAENLVPGVEPALALLLEAYDYAHELERDLWDFAVELDSLRTVDLTLSALRWLLCKGYVEHAIESTRPDADNRSFRSVASLTLAAHSCLVLTGAGAALARQMESSSPHLHSIHGSAGRSGEPEPVPPALPHWDPPRRELRWRNYLILYFKLPSPNQETILTAFEEEGWPPCIGDPLYPQPGQHPTERLHQALTRLNHNQIHRLICFRSADNGSGIRWEWRR